MLRNGQWKFAFEQRGVKGYGVVCEDKQLMLLLVFVVSGDLCMANFVNSICGRYRVLMPISRNFPEYYLYAIAVLAAQWAAFLWPTMEQQGKYTGV